MRIVGHDTLSLKKGYYSAKAARQFGYSIYKTTHGKCVYVTYVSEKSDPLKDYNWDDAVFVGYVTKHIDKFKTISYETKE